MKEKFVEIFFQDEAPRIGSGRRLVKLEIGRKWFYCTVPSTGTRARLPVRLLQILKPVEVKVRRRFRKPRRRTLPSAADETSANRNAGDLGNAAAAR